MGKRAGKLSFEKCDIGRKSSEIFLLILAIQWWLVCHMAETVTSSLSERVSHDKVQILLQSKYCCAGTLYISFLPSDHGF